MHEAALQVIAGNLCKEGMADSRRIVKAWQKMPIDPEEAGNCLAD